MNAKNAQTVAAVRIACLKLAIAGILIINVSSNYKRLSRSLDTLGRKQLPFAFAKTLNETMKAVGKYTVTLNYPSPFFGLTFHCWNIGVRSGRTNNYWEEHICKMIPLYKSFGGAYGLGRRIPSRENPEGGVGSSFLSFAIAINDVLPLGCRRRTMGPEFSLTIQRAHQNG